MLTRYSSLPIGFAKTRTRIDICDPTGRHVPTGERGEIVIIGPNVSPGYLNRPDADERAFYRVDGMRAYRTGDAGHVEDGLLFFDGRLDDQIKLHGFRIEPGDVESNLAALPGVQHAVVLPVARDGRVEANPDFPAPDWSANSRMRKVAQFQVSFRLPRNTSIGQRFPWRSTSIP